MRYDVTYKVFETGTLSFLSPTFVSFSLLVAERLVKESHLVPQFIFCFIQHQMGKRMPVSGNLCLLRSESERFFFFYYGRLTP
mmetsp:Transcript_71581/g.180654  ORF Transcript_71581/g.180654 Transcript_71581/m.180654 type:complete len:83 (+) Transcript_71581:47-295(+)